ncbi:hypothetical protein HU200_014205 [Digitaria exilis]|uniref:Uncharacterized protein n=1 Tax=Digitaria exilis TaxID=1010633 RepID=A0A835FCK1_9POAL|nr:hypothetical protein HU200_014205 [Digitaria exilis]
MGIFTVTKLSEGPVRPSAATPSETLPLTWSAHIYRGVAHTLPSPATEGDALQLLEAPEKKTTKTSSPAAVVHGALADALVHYYPFAGRIVEDVPGRPAVVCTGEGVYFVEAAANCTLADVNFLERPLLVAKEQLQWPVEPRNCPAMIQPGHWLTAKEPFCREPGPRLTANRQSLPAYKPPLPALTSGPGEPLCREPSKAHGKAPPFCREPYLGLTANIRAGPTHIVGSSLLAVIPAHGKGFAVSFCPFGVSPGLTANRLNPVVTTFTCGGFVVGLRTNHAVADGTGVAQFLNAVGDLARGLPEPRVKPVWARDRFPDPDIKPGPLPELPVLALEYIAFDFPATYIDKLKSQYAAFTGGNICSGFDVLIAKLWQCRTRAIIVDTTPSADVRLCFFSGVRHVLKLEHGYYGNAVFPVKVSVSAEKVAGSSVVELVAMVRDAKRRVAEECLSWAEGRTGGRDPFQMAFDYESVYVSDRSKLGSSDVDYGYGKPMSTCPLVTCDLIASVIVMRAPAPLVGTRLLASCVTKEHADDFARMMRDDGHIWFVRAKI